MISTWEEETVWVRPIADPPTSPAKLALGSVLSKSTAIPPNPSHEALQDPSWNRGEEPTGLGLHGLACGAFSTNDNSTKSTTEGIANFLMEQLNVSGRNMNANPTKLDPTVEPLLRPVGPQPLPAPGLGFVPDCAPMPFLPPMPPPPHPLENPCLFGDGDQSTRTDPTVAPHVFMQPFEGMTPMVGNMPPPLPQMRNEDGSMDPSRQMMPLKLPRLRIGSFNLPTYGETDARFCELFAATIRDVTSTAALSRQMNEQQQQTSPAVTPNLKPIFPSISAASTTVGATLSDALNAAAGDKLSGGDPGFSSQFIEGTTLPPFNGFQDLMMSDYRNESFMSHMTEDPSQMGFPTRAFSSICLCCPGGQHDPSLSDCQDGKCGVHPHSFVSSRRSSVGQASTASFGTSVGFSMNRNPSTDRMMDVARCIPLPISSLMESQGPWTCDQIDWSRPHTEPDLPIARVRQLLAFNMVTCDRLLSTYELSVFRTVHCPGTCENSRTPTRCWASHNYATCTDSRRWMRRNPFVYTYKHLLCPEIQSLKDSLKENKNEGGDYQNQRYADKLALQQACFKCVDGVHCQYSHSLEEQMYHPFVYKTAICNNQPDCVRPFCPFLHEGEYTKDENGNLKARKYDSLAAWNQWKAQVRRGNSGVTSFAPSFSRDVSFEEYRPSAEYNPNDLDGKFLDVSLLTQKLSGSLNYRPSESMDRVPTPQESIWSGSLSAPELPKFHAAENCLSAEEEPLDLDTAYPLESIDARVAYRFANELFQDCRKRLCKLELSVFRTARCPHKSYCDNTKTPTRCWATHASNESNRWLRRNPFLFKYKHLLCPHVRPDKNQNRDNCDGKARWLSCPKGRNCNLAHSIEEQMYHPFVYKTSRCINKTCERPFCPFLHNGEDPIPMTNLSSSANGVHGSQSTWSGEGHQKNGHHNHQRGSSKVRSKRSSVSRGRLGG